MTILILLLLLGVCVSIVLWIISKTGLILSNKKRKSAFLKLLNFSYYLLIIFCFLFLTLIFSIALIFNC